VNFICKTRKKGKIKIIHKMTAETLADKLVMTECMFTFAQVFRNGGGGVNLEQKTIFLAINLFILK
jgi:hypothetical protein